MIIHHFFYDLTEFLGAPDELFSNPVFDLLHLIFAGIFIALCGISSQFSRNNLRRGFLCLAIALIITIVTVFIEMPVIFGILHLLSFCIIFYGLTRRLREKIPLYLMPVICVFGYIISSYCTENITVSSEHLWMLGWRHENFVSYDYFPVFPWIFIFLFGTWIGFYIKNQHFPQWFYKMKIPLLSFIGRHSLIAYITHQPVLYLITMLIKTINHRAV